MAIEAIIKKILDGARAEADAIRAKASDQARGIEAEALAKAGREAAGIAGKAADRARQEGERLRTAAAIDSKKQILAEKQKAISAVLAAALEELGGMGRDGYQGIIGNMLSQAEGDEEVILPPHEKRIDAKFIKKVNRARFRGKPGLRLSSERREIPGGGFILRKGRVEKNNSFAVVLDSLRPAIEKQLAEILFS